MANSIPVSASPDDPLSCTLGLLPVLPLARPRPAGVAAKCICAAGTAAGVVPKIRPEAAASVFRGRAVMCALTLTPLLGVSVELAWCGEWASVLTPPLILPRLMRERGAGPRAAATALPLWLWRWCRKVWE